MSVSTEAELDWARSSLLSRKYEKRSLLAVVSLGVSRSRLKKSSNNGFDMAACQFAMRICVCVCGVETGE